MEEEKRRRQAAEKKADAAEKQAEAARLAHSERGGRESGREPTTAPRNDEGRNSFETLDAYTYGDATLLGAQDKIRTLMLYQCYHTYHYHYH